MEEKYESIPGKIYFTFYVEYPDLPKKIEIALFAFILIGLVGFGLLIAYPGPDIIEGGWVIIPLFLLFCLISAAILFVVRLIISVGTWIYVNFIAKNGEDLCQSAPSRGLDEGQGPAEERKGGS